MVGLFASVTSFSIQASYAITNGEIAFTSDRDGNAEIYTMNADGTIQTNISNNPATDTNPRWSPDGTKTAFNSDRDGNPEIYTMNADGTGQTNISNNPAFDFNPDWSPDGTKIVFYSFKDGNYEIYTMNADGTGQTNISNNPEFDNVPDWGSAITVDNDDDGIPNDVEQALTGSQGGLSITTVNSVASVETSFDSTTGQVTILGKDQNGDVLTKTVLPQGSQSSTGQITVEYTIDTGSGDSFDNGIADISGIIAPLPGKTVTLKLADDVNSVCIVDNESHARIIPTPFMCENHNIGHNWMVCSAVFPATNSEGPLTDFYDGITRNFSCYQETINGQTFMTVSGLIHSTLIAEDFAPNHTPDASNAVASISSIWPPNNKMISVNILGITDADDDQITITITGISQDEKTGKTADASGIGTSTVTLRAERDGNGDGRAYHIFFTADDGKGGITNGAVIVKVPHDQSGKRSFDQGALYDSTVPS